jgi:hypothetical protein
MFYYIRYLDLRKLYLMQCKQKNVFLSGFFSVAINSFTGRSLAENGVGLPIPGDISGDLYELCSGLESQ